MLSLLLQAAQQTPQVVPDVQITLQQPLPVGMPEWERTRTYRYRTESRKTISVRRLDLNAAFQG
jgi:hypothetical protein